MMLVLSRKQGEVIAIGDGGDASIEVVVLEIRGNKVRLGVKAPRGLLVRRQEIIPIQQKEQSNGEASR